MEISGCRSMGRKVYILSRDEELRGEKEKQ
jgi:hypothetical protein